MDAVSLIFAEVETTNLSCFVGTLLHAQVLLPFAAMHVDKWGTPCEIVPWEEPLHRSVSGHSTDQIESQPLLDGYHPHRRHPEVACLAHPLGLAQMTRASKALAIVVEAKGIWPAIALLDRARRLQRCAQTATGSRPSGRLPRSRTQKPKAARVFTGAVAFDGPTHIDFHFFPLYKCIVLICFCIVCKL